MKLYNKYNFFKHTYCEFTEVNPNFFKENPIHFKSKADSSYSYTEEGVYRYSNHWGRVANCRWKLIADNAYKTQVHHLGFAKWTDFYALNETEKQFYISVDFKMNKVGFYHKKERDDVFLFYLKEAHKRIIQIRTLLKEEKWANYFDQNIDELRKNIISKLISSNKTLQEIKAEFS
ncbi:MAG: hypothetical protein HWD85_00405 [Flavobacteriaceae bacterium]|nr:hypothetical protein [Flavobacteriaceae bacterium]